MCKKKKNDIKMLFCILTDIKYYLLNISVFYLFNKYYVIMCDSYMNVINMMFKAPNCTLNVYMCENDVKAGT